MVREAGLITGLGFLLPYPPRAISLRVPLKSSQKLRLGQTGHPPSSLLRGREESWVISDLSDAWMGPRWTRFLFLVQDPVFFNNFSKRGVYTREQGCKIHPCSHGFAGSMLQPSSLPYLDAFAAHLYSPCLFWGSRSKQTAEKARS